MARPLHVALIGQKFMGKAHSNAWSQAGKFFDLPRPVVLHTVAARDATELEPFARRWGWKFHTTSWRELALDPAIELVDVTTPNDLHAPQAIAMLESGKHVACEKPLADTLEAARAMRDAAKRAKTKTFVWFNYRRCPAVALAFELMREKRLGRVYHVRARYLQSWGGPATPMAWRFQERRAGSGVHGDLNAHCIDLARFLLGEEIKEVHGALARTFVRERIDPSSERKRKMKSDVDDSMSFLASFASGATASFEATRLATGHENANAIEISGEKGALRFDFDEMNVLHVHEGGVDDRDGGWKRIVATSPHHPYAGCYWPEGHWLGYEHGFVSMAADVVKAVARRKPTVPLPDFADAYETQRVLEAALVSARERCAVKLSQIR